MNHTPSYYCMDVRRDYHDYYIVFTDRNGAVWEAFSGPFWGPLVKWMILNNYGPSGSFRPAALEDLPHRTLTLEVYGGMARERSMDISPPLSFDVEVGGLDFWIVPIAEEQNV